MTTTTPQLCFDVVRIVVGLVHHEIGIETLRACTLVNQEWWCASRPCVFRRITLVDTPSLDEFERVLDENCDVAEMVQTLVVRSNKEPLTHPSWIMDVVRRLPARLPRVQAIEITQLLEDGTICTHEFFHALSNFAAVTMLRLHECAMELRMVYSFACSLPGLQRLHIGPVITSHNWRVDIPPELPLPSLTALSLAVQDSENDDMADILEWAIDHSSASLRTFELDIEYLQSECVAKFLREHGALIGNLSLRMVRSVNRLWEYNREYSGDIQYDLC